MAKIKRIVEYVWDERSKEAHFDMPPGALVLGIGAGKDGVAVYVLIEDYDDQPRKPERRDFCFLLVGDECPDGVYLGSTDYGKTRVHVVDLTPVRQDSPEEHETTSASTAGADLARACLGYIAKEECDGFRRLVCLALAHLLGRVG